jgi:hypothetical protein
MEKSENILGTIKDRKFNEILNLAANTNNNIAKNFPQ